MYKCGSSCVIGINSKMIIHIVRNRFCLFLYISKEYGGLDK